MNRNSVTNGQMDEIIDVWENHMDEYSNWADDHGVECLNKWNEMYPDKGIINQGFTYYLITKFKEWKIVNAGGV